MYIPPFVGILECKGKVEIEKNQKTQKKVEICLELIQFEMFTGIIEALGEIKKIETTGSNVHFWVHSPLLSSLKVDQSLAHEGVCLTVDQLGTEWHRVTAVQETLSKTNLADWKVGKKINLERCLVFNGRLDGHFVQGHADATATVTAIKDQNGSWLFTFSYDPAFAALLIEKGSISINGTSLTVFNVKTNEFSVAIIPYTYQHTTFHTLQEGDRVNIEFDVIGKYIQRLSSIK